METYFAENMPIVRILEIGILKRPLQNFIFSFNLSIKESKLIVKEVK